MAAPQPLWTPLPLSAHPHLTLHGRQRDYRTLQRHRRTTPGHPGRQFWSSLNRVSARRRRGLGSGHWLGSTVASIGCLGLARHRRVSRRLSRGKWSAGVVGRAAVDEELCESLQERTLESLDFDYVIEKLREQCCTAPALALSEDPSALLADSPEEATRLYSAVLELATLEDADLELSEPLNIQAELDACTAGAVLEPSQLQNVAATVKALLQLRNGLERASMRGAEIPWLIEAAERIELPDQLLDLMLDAFDEEGELSEEKFPELAERRQRIQALEERCAEEIRVVLTSGRYMRYLVDEGYMQVGGRYVVSVKPQHKNKVGQVVDESRSGRTVYVEPKELSPFSTELTQQQSELKFLVRRILSRMCVAVSRSSEQFQACLEAAGEIDLARARLFLGEDMEGEVPEVGSEGVIMARHARNPCLLLRGGTRVVGNRLELGNGLDGLILSGPNAGGKTVILKTIGLLALLARCGIPVPAGESPRIDFFDEVLAEIGDMQTIVDDLSTYSAHLVASRIMLSQASRAQTHALLLVDEAGTGTDPMQGAALARAVLEAMLETGARVIATTHSMQLKNWALEDKRLEVAAMEYKGNRPTFKLIRNEIGESHAIETARRLELPSATVRRAEALLSDDQRSLLMLQRKAEALQKELQEQLAYAEEREAEAEEASRMAEQRAASFAEREEMLNQAEAELEARRERLRGQLEAEYRAKGAAQERQIEALVQDLRTQLSKNGGNLNGLKLVGPALGQMRVERDKEAEAAAAAAERKKQIPGALGKDDPLHPGDWVIVLAKTAWYGFKGSVKQVIQAGGGRTHVKLSIQGSNTSIEVLKTELGKVAAPTRAARQPAKKKARDYSKVAGGFW